MNDNDVTREVGCGGGEGVASIIFDRGIVVSGVDREFASHVQGEQLEVRLREIVSTESSQTSNDAYDGRVLDSLDIDVLDGHDDAGNKQLKGDK